MSCIIETSVCKSLFSIGFAFILDLSITLIANISPV